MNQPEPLMYDTFESPVGDLLAAVGPGGLRHLALQDGPNPLEIAEPWRHSRRAVAPVRRQLSEYFEGERTRFELDLAPAGTAFQRAVWAGLERIPAGETTSYSELAGTLGRPGAARAVGAANARNPRMIVTPCHRVVGARGALTGFAGGLEAKRFLLGFEAGLAGGRTYSLVAADGSTYESRLPGALGNRV